MKLLTTGGLLYSTVQAQNADGTRGTYQSFDYVAMFPEGQNGGINVASSTTSATNTPINVGWDPVVVEVLSNWDGGKTIAGFGKLTGTIYGSWVIKMWGATGTTNCGNDSKIAGYVTMVVGLTADLALAANCSLATAAKVQWAWTNVATNFLTTAANRYSFVILSATEEYVYGAETVATVGLDSYIIVAGGSTVESSKNGGNSYGLNSWNYQGEFITFDGVTATNNALANGATPTPVAIDVINVAGELIYYVGASDAKAILNLSSAANHCWTAVAGHPAAVDAVRAMIGGYTMSITSCLKHAVDGYSFWGTNVMAKVGKDWANTTFITANASLAVTQTYGESQFNSQVGSPAGTSQAGINLAQVRVIKMNYFGLAAAGFDAFFLCTSSEYYYQSILVGGLSNAAAFAVTQGDVAWAIGTYGSAWNFWPFLAANANAATLIGAQDPDNVVVVGTKAGKGTIFRGTLTSDPLKYTATDTTIFTVNAAAGVVSVDAPTGGMGQFKGTTYSTVEALYVQVICTSVAPMYYATWLINLDSDTSNGWVVSCYTGIPQCSTSLADGITRLDNVTGTVSTTCMNDPRYMTWRVMTLKVDKAGTISWWRTDSYWDSSSTMFSSTWGTGVVLSTNVVSNDDNNGTTNLGKTFVFAYGDGSGIQLNHIAFGTSPVSSNTSAAAGTNTLTSAPTTFSNTYPTMFRDNMCLGSNLELTGTTDTSALAATITEWSDGYKAKLTLSLEMLLQGAAGGWRGVCMVYYSSQYVMDNTNGSVCYAAQVDNGTGKGPIDFGAGYLMSVGSAVWQPPAMTASLAPSSSALTGGKYSIVYAPTAATAFMYTEGYYSSVTYYQPKYASSYTGIARYGKDDYIGAFCMQGSGANSYFSSTAASVKLTGAMYLAVGVVSLGTVLSLAI